MIYIDLTTFKLTLKNHLMRYLTTLSICCLLFLKVGAQKIIFADKTNRWHCVTTRVIPSQAHTKVKVYSIYTADRDTIINGTYYVKIGTVAVRHDTAENKVYFFDTTDKVLYDYTLQVGDTFYAPKEYAGNRYPAVAYSVDKVDSVLLNTTYHKRISLKVIDRAKYDFRVSGYSFTEGIGCERNPLFPITGFNTYEDQFNDYIQCFKSQGKIPSIFTNCADTILGVNESIAPNAIPVKIYPQPTHSEITIELPDNMHGSISIYNISGQHVHTKPFTDKRILNITLDVPGGLYFYKIRDTKRSVVYTGKLSMY